MRRMALPLLLSAWTGAAMALDINLATEAELDSLRGFGPSLTAKVLAARQDKAFAHWADLMKRVSGIREATAQRLSDQGVTVQGRPYTAPHKAP